MKSIIVWLAAAFTFTTAAQAQQPEPRSRAPLAGVEDLEPAVDVGAEQPAATDRPAERSVAMLNPSRLVTEPPPVVAPPPAPTEAPQPSNTRVIDTLDLGTTSITGNQELPKVLYIVPWKKSDLGDLVGRPVNTLLDEVLAPVDPEVFERHLDYYETLNGKSEEE
jgi:hypothetical protein